MSSVSGILNIRKPSGITSRDVVNRVLWQLRKETGQRRIKVGHCGTLDPMATGVLVVCVGSATRLVSTIQELPKTYRGTFQLGVITDTDDITGTVLRESTVEPGSIAEQNILKLLPEFTGRIQQVPPDFSAVHVNGQRAYERARRGEDLELEARTVNVYELKLERFCPPQFELLLRCGSGTYVRSIGRDIGLRLGCGATMTALERTAIGSFEIESAIDPDASDISPITDRLLPLHWGAAHLRRLRLTDRQVAQVRNGRGVPLNLSAIEPAEQKLPVEPDGMQIALLSPAGNLIALAGGGRSPGQLQPRIVFPDSR